MPRAVAGDDKTLVKAVAGALVRVVLVRGVWVEVTAGVGAGGGGEGSGWGWGAVGVGGEKVGREDGCSAAGEGHG